MSHILSGELAKIQNLIQLKIHLINEERRKLPLMENKFCQCGCGIQIDSSKVFAWGHNRKGKRNKMILYGRDNPNWKGGKGYISTDGYHVRSVNNGIRIIIHREIVEKVLGKPLQLNSVIHHFDENRENNRNNNLIVCQDQAYHLLLHKRMLALQASGHVDWLRCYFCKQYDSPENIHSGKRMQYHTKCTREYYWKNKNKGACNETAIV